MTVTSGQDMSFALVSALCLLVDWTQETEPGEKDTSHFVSLPFLVQDEQDKHVSCWYLIGEV